MKLAGVLTAAFLIPVSGTAEVTYSREISRITRAKCQQCHRPNDIAPFALSTYEDAYTWALDIKRVINDKLMPPWKPVAGHGEFRGSYALTSEEREQFVQWVDNGAPRGDPAEAPPPIEEKGEWQLGPPDLVLEMPEPFTPTRGRDLYRCFVLPTGLDASKFVSAVDILPGNRQVVHHVILYVDNSGEAEKLDAKDEGPGYTCYGGPGLPTNSGAGLAALLAAGSGLGGWAPGVRAYQLPDGIGLFLDARARVVMQVHYYTNQRIDTEDRTKVGLYFSQKPIERRLVYLPLLPLDSRSRFDLTIPAGESAYESKSSFTVPPFLDMKAVNIDPHMHLLGRQIRVDLEIGKETRPMVYIDNWEFNWQSVYTYLDPVPMPAFSTLRLTCTYDNTANNPRNPNTPIKTVTWGEGTEDEMCVALIGVTFDRENLLPFQSRR